MGKTMRVDPDKLNALAARVQRLHDDLNGNVSGSLPKLQAVGKQNLQTALGSMAGDGNATSAFVDSYDMEHGALISTYQSMVSQLQELQRRCTSTAALHGKNEANNRTVVDKSGAEI